MKRARRETSHERAMGRAIGMARGFPGEPDTRRGVEPDPATMDQGSVTEQWQARSTCPQLQRIAPISSLFPMTLPPSLVGVMVGWLH